MDKHLWLNWYKEYYLTSEHWTNLRREKLEATNYTCEQCGTSKNLQIHHLHYRSLWYESLEELKTLCKNCHEREHGY